MTQAAIVFGSVPGSSSTADTLLTSTAMCGSVLRGPEREREVTQGYTLRMRGERRRPQRSLPQRRGLQLVLRPAPRGEGRARGERRPAGARALLRHGGSRARPAAGRRPHSAGRRPHPGAGRDRRLRGGSPGGDAGRIGRAARRGAVRRGLRQRGARRRR